MAHLPSYGSRTGKVACRFADPRRFIACLGAAICMIALATTQALADLPPSPKDWTLNDLQRELGSDLKKNPTDDRWEIPAKDFWRHVPKPLRDMKGARRTYNRGCVGISDLFAGDTWGWPPEIFDLCYFDEAIAVAKLKNHECPDGFTPNVIAIRFWDHNKARSDSTPLEADGRVPNAKERFDKGKAKGPGLVNFDFGYRLADGSYIHANHSEPGMKVKVSKDANTYDRNGTYPGFNTLLFCVTCVADLSSPESVRQFKRARRGRYPEESDQSDQQEDSQK